MRSRCLIAAFPVAALLLAGCDRDTAPTAEQVALNNLGVANMGYFNYEAGHDAFATLIEQRPGWIDARVNLAIATLNRQYDGDEGRALAIVDEVLADEPGNLRAAYVAGLLRLYLGETEQARKYFEQVIGGDPNDAYAAYYLGQAMLQEDRASEALSWYETAIELDPYLRSAYYSASQVARRMGNKDIAAAWMRDYMRLEENPRARLAEFKYTRMGPKAMVLAVDARDGLGAQEKPVGDVFGEQQHIGILPVGDLSSADINGDGEQEIFVARAGLLSEQISTRGGSFVAPAFPFGQSNPINEVDRIVAPLWGDIDNDGLIDVYFCRDGENQLWRQSEPGVWVEDTQPPLGNPYRCAGGAVFDADHDGDLDYFVVNRDGPSSLLNNNLDGTFRELAADQGLAGPGAGGVQVLVADLDSDRDTDIVVLYDNAPNDVFINDRLWQYRPAHDMDTFVAQPLLAAVAGDLDADGWVELYGATPDGALMRWRRDESGNFVSDQLAKESPDAVASLMLQDFDGDGRADLLWRRTDNTRLMSIPGEGPVDVLARIELSLASFVTHLDDVRRGPSLVTLDMDENLRLHPPGSGRYDFLAMQFTGKEDSAESMRSNRSGIGTQVAMRHGSNWSASSTFSHASSPGQSLQPLAMGLAGADRADFVEIDWTDGVFQTEIGLEAGRLHLIPETQRQLSSCPVLFAWDGERYRFVSDVLGVGGLGFLIEPGLVADPRPWEFFLFPQGLLQPKDGRYRIKLTEPMEENAYLDQARLHVYDLPPDWSMVMDERMGTGLPDVTGKPLFYRYQSLPVRVTDQDGTDVTKSVLANDYAAAPLPGLDTRFIGRLAEPHVLTLEFDTALEAPVADATPVLVADGWVEYPYSQTVFAAWQAGETYTPPSLEYRDADGEWTLLYAQFGYPAGMPRRMALPLPGLPDGVTALRLSGGIEVYWDRLGVAWAEPPAELAHQIVSPAFAELAQTGFPLRTTGPQRLPVYDYSQRKPFWDTRYMTGFYTGIGPATALITDHDDGLAIIGPGEEIDMHFDVPSLRDGWQRWLVLEARGYAKDMDLFTRDGGTVGPLPTSVADAGDEFASERSKKLHSLYNARFQSGH